MGANYRDSQSVMNLASAAGVAVTLYAKWSTHNMALIPSGTFWMGSPLTETGRSTNEDRHQVTLSKSYYMGVYQVTQDQYAGVMGALNNNSNFSGSNNPVEQVSWYDAVEFCNFLSDSG